MYVYIYITYTYLNAHCSKSLEEMISWQAFTILLQTCFFCGQPSPRPHGTSGWLLLLPHPLSWSIGDQSSASPESTKIMRYFFGLRKILYLLLSTVRKLITHNYLHCFITYFYVFSYLCIEILHSFFIHHGYFNSGTAVQLLLLPTAFDKTPRGPPRGILNIPTTGKQLWCSKCGPKSEVQTTISQFLHLSNTTDFASCEAPGANSAHKHYASRIKSTKVIDFTSAGLELYTSHLEFASRSLHLQHTTNIAVGFPPCCLGSPNRILRNATCATCWSGWLHRMPTIPRFSDCGQTRKTSANLPNFNQHLVAPSNLSSSPLSINNPQASATAAIRFNECKTLKYAWRW